MQKVMEMYVTNNSEEMVEYFKTYRDKRYRVLHEHFLTIRHVLQFMGHRGGIKARDQQLGIHSYEIREANRQRNQALVDANQHPLHQPGVNAKAQAASQAAKKAGTAQHREACRCSV